LKFSRKFSVLSVFVYQDCGLLTFFIALASNIFTLSSSTPLTTEIYESDSNPHEQQKHTNQQTQKKTELATVFNRMIKQFLNLKTSFCAKGLLNIEAFNLRNRFTLSSLKEG
jgi:hypothetical protein